VVTAEVEDLRAAHRDDVSRLHADKAKAVRAVAALTTPFWFRYGCSIQNPVNRLEMKALVTEIQEGWTDPT
jgi:hypothetical protein